MNGKILILGLIGILVLVVATSGCSLTSATPKCPVCNSTDNVVTFVNADNNAINRRSAREKE